MKKRVLIACPAKSGIPAYWFKCALDLSHVVHPEFTFDIIVEAGHGAINMARNIIADRAITGDYWAVGQLDDDMHWRTPDAIIRLCAHLLEVDFVYAPYVRKQSGPVRWLVVEKAGATPTPSGLMECDFVGTGAHFSRVSALRALCAFYPERRFTYEEEVDGMVVERQMTELYPIGLVGPNTPEGRLQRIKDVLRGTFSGVPDSNYGISFSTEPQLKKERLEIIRIISEVHPGESRLLGEDFGFCHLARKAGFKLWSDRDYLIPHMGPTEYPISAAQLSTAAQVPHNNLDFSKY